MTITCVSFCFIRSFKKRKRYWITPENNETCVDNIVVYRKGQFKDVHFDQNCCFLYHELDKVGLKFHLLSIYLSIYLSIHLSIYLSIYQSINQSRTEQGGSKVSDFFFVLLSQLKVYHLSIYISNQSINRSITKSFVI